MPSVRHGYRRSRVFAKRLLGLEPRVRETVSVPLEFHGNDDGGWAIVAGSLNATSVVVDVGVGEDTSFSESIARRYGCPIHAFDPTPRAIQHVQALQNDQFRLYEVGLGTSAGVAPFFLPDNESHVSGALRQEVHLGRGAIQVTVVTIGQLFDLLPCERIDLLKLDIEGTEFDLIESTEFRERARAIGQFCVEFHHRWPGRGKGSTENAVRALAALGFECAWRCRDTNEEFLFIRRSAEPWAGGRL